MAELLPLMELSFTPAAVPKPVDQPGELLWLPIDCLVIDPSYQRPLSERGMRNIKSIVENFSWMLFSPLVVSPREFPLYAIIDGQHRAIGARCHGGIPKVPCYVISGNVADQAKAFTVINGHVTAVTPQQLYYAKIVAGDKLSLEVKAVLDIAGVTVIRGNKSKNDLRVGETTAIDAITNCYVRVGKDTLITALQTITETGDGNRGFVMARIVSATCAVLHLRPRWRDSGDKLFKAIETTSIPKLYDRAEKRRLKEDINFHESYVRGLSQLLTDQLGA